MKSPTDTVQLSLAAERRDFFDAGNKGSFRGEMSGYTDSVVIFGAGNIGRGLLGERLAAAHWRTIFVEADEALRGLLAGSTSYRVRLVGRDPCKRYVSDFEVLGPSDAEALKNALARCRFAATAVGGQNLQAIAPFLVEGLYRRDEPLNILLCENWPRPEEALGQALNEAGAAPETYRLVPSSVERMVRRGEDLELIGESSETVIIDRSSWHGPIPPIEGLIFVDEVEPYYKRKLYTNNAGQVVLAYLGHLRGSRLLIEALAQRDIAEDLNTFLQIASRVLEREYCLSCAHLDEHLMNLLEHRFSNKELADTIERVARQPIRKLGPSERLIGLLRLAEKYELDTSPICKVTAAALHYFDPEDDQCREMRGMIEVGGPGQVLLEVCKLRRDEIHYERCLEYYESLRWR